MDLAPIAIFTYKRPQHTRQLMLSLLENQEMRRSRVHVYSDGPKTVHDAPLVESTRAVIKSFRLPNLTITERSRNMGLSGNVVDGVGQACAAHGRIIVLEDDLQVSPTFLSFMNDALNRYRDAPEVMHVSGYMFPVRLREDTQAVFLPFINVSGWATWERAWRRFDAAAAGYDQVARDPMLRRAFDLDGKYYFFHMLELFKSGRIDSWAIRWYLTVFLQHGLAAYPAKSLVENCGYDANGTHTTGPPPPHGRAKALAFRATSLPEPVVDAAVYRRVRRLLAKEISLPNRVIGKMRQLWKAAGKKASGRNPL